VGAAVEGVQNMRLFMILGVSVCGYTILRSSSVVTIRGYQRIVPWTKVPQKKKHVAISYY
jgi:hypothetical protein